MKARPATLLVPSLAIFTLCAAAIRDVDKSSGIVVGIKGDWVLNKPTGETNNQLKFLLPIPSGKDTCAYGKGGYLTLAFGEKASPFMCDKKVEAACDVKNAPPPVDRDKTPYVCARQIVPPEEAPKYSGFLAALKFQAIKFPELFATPVSRGLEADLTDAVVQMKDNSVDFGPAFSEMNAGMYSARLEAIDAPGKAVATIHMEWKEGAPASAPVPNLQSGVYGLVRLQADGKPAGQVAWVLLTTADKFAKQSSEFGSFSTATKQWPDQVDARAPRAVSRAFLQALASSSQ
jgi:hypothetical protein